MSEDSSGGGEKVFDPTPQKLDEARRKGDIPKSQDVTAAATYLAFLAVLVTAGTYAVDRAASVLMVFHAHPDRLIGHVLGPGGGAVMARIVGQALAALIPVFAIPIGAVVISLSAQRAVTFAGSKIQPKLSKISPLSNAKQKFGPTGLVEFLKSFVKVLAISGTLALYLRRNLDTMIGSVRTDPRVLGALMLDLLVLLLAVICVIAVVVAALDIVWQRFDHTRKLRMSFQEIKDETKQSEGDPHMKAQRRQRAEAIATNQMMFDVPKADVVIVNPVHYAVALKWERARGSAPVCVAKGEGAVALRIREIAETADVPVHRDPPTARALHAAVEIGQEIAPEHYRAVAAAIRFSDSLRRAARERGRR